MTIWDFSELFLPFYEQLMAIIRPRRIFGTLTTILFVIFVFVLVLRKAAENDPPRLK